MPMRLPWPVGMLLRRVQLLLRLVGLLSSIGLLLLLLLLRVLPPVWMLQCMVLLLPV